MKTRSHQDGLQNRTVHVLLPLQRMCRPVGLPEQCTHVFLGPPGSEGAITDRG